MRSIRFTIAKNASANVIRGGASAVVAIVLPHFLTRSLGVDRFAGWALMLQVAKHTQTTLISVANGSRSISRGRTGIA